MLEVHHQVAALEVGERGERRAAGDAAQPPAHRLALGQLVIVRDEQAALEVAEAGREPAHPHLGRPRMVGAARSELAHRLLVARQQQGRAAGAELARERAEFGQAALEVSAQALDAERGAIQRTLLQLPGEAHLASAMVLLQARAQRHIAEHQQRGGRQLLPQAARGQAPGRRGQHRLLEPRHRLLAEGVEAPHRVDGVAEELDAQRILADPGEHIEDAAAHRQLAAPLDRAGDAVAGLDQAVDQAVQLVLLARPEDQRGGHHLLDVGHRLLGGDRVRDQDGAAAEGLERGHAPAVAGAVHGGGPALAADLLALLEAVELGQLGRHHSELLQVIDQGAGVMGDA